ncbi:MAG TPA: NAD-dependent epimerase/dehydratase family protein [Vicinamibacterales bacterium]|jgi:UDP-glucose 4-epimerase|nr:NAD-dependent epimerase/dehydratase family protein [Vicinamibacterales bacterium]
MQLVVTGASGFIGRNVLLRATRDWEVPAFYHLSPDFDAFVREHGLTNVAPVRCNLLEGSEIRSLLPDRKRHVDAVLYLAANGDPTRSVERPHFDLDANAAALINFLEHFRVDHFVYVSSGAVYDGLVGPVSPETAVSPRLPYAISKLAAEQYVRFFAERRKTIGSYIIVRFFGAYGPLEPARKMTTRWLKAIAAGERELVVRGDGDNLVDFVYIDDAVDGLLTLVNAKGVTATVDFGSGSPVTVNEVAERTAHALGVRVTIRHEGQTEEYIRFRSSDTTMRDRFAVTSAITLSEGLMRLAAIVQAS